MDAGHTLEAADLATTLRREGASVSGLMRRLASDAVAEDRQALWAELFAHLSAWTDAEQDMVYKPLERVPALLPVAAERRREQASIRKCLVEVDEMLLDDIEFPARLARLRSAVEEHVRDEEELLPAVERAIGREERERITADYLRRRNALLRDR